MNKQCTDLIMNDKAAVDAVTQIKENGGITLNLNDNSPVPDSGYMVSMEGKERVFSFPVELDFFFIDIVKEIRRYLLDHGDQLSTPGFYFGAWLEKGTSITGAHTCWNLYLDISVNWTGERAAIHAGVINHQKAIYDISAGKSIDISMYRYDRRGNLVEIHDAGVVLFPVK